MNQAPAKAAGRATATTCSGFTRPAISMVRAQTAIRAAVPKSWMTTRRQSRPTGTTAGTKPRTKLVDRAEFNPPPGPVDGRPNAGDEHRETGEEGNGRRPEDGRSGHPGPARGNR